VKDEGIGGKRWQKKNFLGIHFDAKKGREKGGSTRANGNRVSPYRVGASFPSSNIKLLVLRNESI